jgi:hypothetical protein
VCLPVPSFDFFTASQLKKDRKSVGKKPTPTAVVIDSRSEQTTGVGGDNGGYDAGKKTSGRKRYFEFDTLGMILVVVVHATDVQDQAGGLLRHPGTSRGRESEPLPRSFDTSIDFNTNAQFSARSSSLHYGAMVVSFAIVPVLPWTEQVNQTPIHLPLFRIEAPELVDQYISLREGLGPPQRAERLEK